MVNTADTQDHKEEVIASLNHLTEDAIDYHMQNGDPVAEEKLKQSTPEIKEIKNLTLIGESHIRSVHVPEYDNKFQELLTTSDIIVVEHDCVSPNSYSSVSPVKRFMQEAQEHAIHLSKELHILDTENGNGLNNNYRLVENAGFTISKEDYAYMVCTYVLQRYFLTQVPFEDSKDMILTTLRQFLPDEDSVLNVSSEVFDHYVLSLENIDAYKQAHLVEMCFVNIDGISREVSYQQRISKYCNDNPDKRVMAVLGKDHVIPTEKALVSGYRTPPEYEWVANQTHARHQLRKILTSKNNSPVNE